MGTRSGMWRRLWCAALGLALVSGLSAQLILAGGGEPKVEGAAPAAAVEDATFDRYVNLKQLADACEALDSAGVTDAVLQFAEAERILQRPHRNGTSVKQLFPMAIKLAADQRDIASLSRLAKAAGQSGLKDAEELAASVKKIAASPARSLKPLLVPIDQIDVDNIQTYRHLQGEIEKARLRGNKEALQELSGGMLSWIALTEAQQKHLKQAALDAIKEMPETPDAETEMLRKLSGGGRGSVALTLDANSGGSGSLTTTGSGSSLQPYASINLRNGLKTKLLVFQLHGTGKTYSLKAGQSGSYTVYGRFTAPPPLPVQYGQVALDFSGGSSGTIVPPKMLIGQTWLTLTNGNFNILNRNGSDSVDQWTFYLQRR